MTASRPPASGTPLPELPKQGSALLRLVDECSANALSSGALKAIRTEHIMVHDAGIPFIVRWVSSLADKEAILATPRPAHVSNTKQSGKVSNPFLPPEPALTLARIGPQHLCLLNKFPVIARHLLIVTRDFAEQSAPLDTADHAALGCVLDTVGGLGFYNGGTQAGASQRHKHLQWIPDSPLGARLEGLLAGLRGHHHPAGQACFHPGLHFRHVFIRQQAALPPAERLRHAMQQACQALQLDAAASPMPAYNLLANREWLLLVPRSREDFEGISVNALGFATSLFVRHPGELSRIREIGPLAVLRAVAQPL